MNKLLGKVGIMFFLLFSLQYVTAQSIQPLEWESITGYCDDKGVWRRCMADSWGKAGYISKNKLSLGSDGEMFYIISETGMNKAVGFSDKNETNYLEEIKFGLYQDRDDFYVIESGNLLAVVRGIRQGEELKLRVESGRIHYFHNDRLIYTSGDVVKTDLYISGTSYNDGVIIDDIKTTLEVPSNLPNAEWASITGYCENSGVWTRCISQGWGKAGFISKNKLEDGQEGELYYNITELGVNKMVGLSDKNQTNHYSELKFGLYQAGGNFHVFESGSSKAYVRNIKVGDKLGIKVESGKVKYYYNNTLVYMSSSAITSDLFITGVSYQNGVLLDDIKTNLILPDEPVVYNTATAYKNLRVIEIKNTIEFAYLERYSKNSGEKLDYKILDLTLNSKELVQIKDFDVQRGMNYYQCDLSQLIQSSELVSNHRYRIEIFEDSKKPRYFDFVYKNN